MVSNGIRNKVCLWEIKTISWLNESPPLGSESDSECGKLAMYWECAATGLFHIDVNLSTWSALMKVTSYDQKVIHVTAYVF